MAKKSMIARDVKRAKMNKNRARRNELVAIVKSATADFDEKLQAMIALNKRPRDESHCRMRTRCRSCGRPRAVYRRFGLCRICLRNAAMQGHVPGLTKSSW